jgi:hypothetical protein
MALTKVTVTPAVNEWGAAAPPAWTAAEADSITDAVVAISKQVTPRVVPDVVIATARLQAYLLARTVSYLEGWLIAAASTLRRAYGMEAVRLTVDATAPALGLRAATIDELIALPGVDRGLATRIAQFTAQSPDFDGIDALVEIDGIGPDRVRQLEAVAYRDAPWPALLSPALTAFVASPGIPEFLRLLEPTDLEVSFGDGSTLLHRPQAADRTRAERFLGLLTTALDQATRASSVASATLASKAAQWLDRHEARAQLLAAMRPGKGAILINGAYLDPVKKLVDDSATSVKLMVFVGSDSAGTAAAPGPLSLIEALEAAKARGVTVRVILDQDLDGVPYRSAFINRPLVQRLSAAGVDVKLDEKDTLLHSKVLVVDGATVVVGSHNWTRNSMAATHEVSVLVDSAETASDFEARFDALWNRLPPL